MPRFYIEAELAVDTQVELTETVFHHWVKVLRAQVGETATLLMGKVVNMKWNWLKLPKKQRKCRLKVLIQTIASQALAPY